MAPSKNDRISPDKRMIAVLVYLTACMQVLGFCFLSYSDMTSLSHYLLSIPSVSFPQAVVVNQIYMGAMLLSLLWAFFRWSPWPFYLIGLLFLGESFAKTLIGNNLQAHLALAGECARYLWFLAIGFALRNARTLDVEIGLPQVRLLLRLGLALTFFTHGIAAFMNQGGSLQTVIESSEHLVASPLWSEFVSKNALLLIGLMDMLVAILVLLKPKRNALVYMAFWGALTAFSRMFVAPELGFFEAMLRAPHYMLPLLIMIIEGQRSIRKPIRHAYTDTLKKIGLTVSH